MSNSLQSSVSRLHAKGLIVARDVLFLTLLMDTKGEEVNTELWNIFHNSYVNPTALDLIREQSAKVVVLSATAESWNSSPYGNILQIINTETLRKLNLMWSNWANPSEPDNLRYNRFRKIFRESLPLIGLIVPMP